MPTLILTPRFTTDAQILWQAAVNLGWEIERLSSWRVPEDVRRARDPVLYLEGLFGPTLAKEFGLRLLEAADDWLPKLPEEFRKRHITLSTLEEARKRSEPAFIKPPNDKSFEAKVYRGVDLPVSFESKMPVLISEVVTWESEFRCFVLDRKVRTRSVYMLKGEFQREQNFAASEAQLSEAEAFADTVLADPRIEFPRASVLDIGVMAGRGWAVIEQNSAWGSGIYGCDPVQVLEVLRYAAVKA